MDLENSTVTSLVTNRPGSVRVCAGTLNGSAVVSGATGFVLIGDSGDDGCKPNTIRGVLILANNTHGLEAIGNHVSFVLAAGNSGAGAFPEDNAPEVSGNHL